MPIPWIPINPRDRFIESLAMQKSEETPAPMLPWSPEMAYIEPSMRAAAPAAGATLAPTQQAPAISSLIARNREQLARRQMTPTGAIPADTTTTTPTVVNKAASDVEWWEEPAELADKATQKVGEAISKVPILPEVLNWASPVFEFLGNIDRAWGALITAGASPKLEWQQGENWLTHQMREYEAWESPTYTKGIVEFLNPVWWIPFAGWAAKAAKAVGVGGKALKGIQSAARVMETVGLSGEIGGFKQAEKLAKAAASKSSLFAEGRLALPTTQQISEALFTGDNLSKVAAWAERMPGLRRVKKLINEGGDLQGQIVLAENRMTRTLEPRYLDRYVDGEQASASIKDYVKQQTILRDYTNSVASDGMSSLLLPELQRYGNPQKLLNAMDNGLTSVNPLQAGVGTGTVDVAENFINYTGQIDRMYAGLTDEAKEYLLGVKKIATELDNLLVDEFRDAALRELPQNATEKQIVRKARELAGVNQDEILLPRLVEGKFTPDGFEKSRHGINSELGRVHKTMDVGIKESPGFSVKYDPNLNHNVQQLIDNYARKISNHRYAEGVQPLGKTLKESLYAYEPEFMEKLAKVGVRVADISHAERTLANFMSVKGSFFQPATIRKIMSSTAVPQTVKDKIALATKLSPDEAKKLIDHAWSRQSVKKGFTKNDFINEVMRGKDTGVKDIFVQDIEGALAKLSEKGHTKSVITNAYNTMLTNRSRTQLIKEAREELGGALGMAKDDLADFQGQYQKLKAQYSVGGFSRATKAVSRVMDEAGNIIEKPVVREFSASFNKHPAFGGRLFPVEAVEAAEKTLGDQGNELFKRAAETSGVLRTMIAAMDFSAPFIQGLPTLARNPAAWLRGVKEMFKEAGAPGSYTKYLSQPENMAAHAERLFFGSAPDISEFHESLPMMTQALGRVPKAGETLQTISKQTLGRTEAAYATFGAASRDELWQAMRHKAIDPLTGRIDNKLGRELAATIDKLTGALNVSPLLIGKSQKQFENAFMFFASRYTRSGLALAGDVFRGGLKGSEARKAMGGMMAGGTLMYLRTCALLGQQPELDPRTGRFMTVKIGDYHVGIGGLMTSLMRFGYDVAATAKEDPGAFLEWGNRFDNPFTKFLYSRASPLTGTLEQIWNQKDYLGEPLDDPVAWANWLAGSATPIAFQTFLDDTSFASKLAVLGPELMGGRNFPKSDSELMVEARNKEAQKYGFKTYAEIPYTALAPDGRKVRDLINTNKEVVNLSDMIQETAKRRGYTDIVRSGDFHDELQSARQTMISSVALAEQAFNAGLQDGNEFRERTKLAKYGYSVQVEDIYKRYADVVSEFNTNPKTTADMAYNMLLAAYTSGKFEDQYGIYDYQAADQYRESILTRLTAEDRAAVEGALKARDLEMPALYQEYRKAVEVLRPYWEVATEANKYFGERDSTSKQRFISRRRKILKRSSREIEHYYNLFYGNQEV